MSDTTTFQEDRPEPRRLTRPWLWPCVYLLLRGCSPFIRVPYPVLGNILATVLFLVLPLLWLRDLCRIQRPAWMAVGVFVLLALVWANLAMFPPFGIANRLPWTHHIPLLRAALLLRRPIADLALITGAALLGGALAAIVRDPKMLLPIALVGAGVDYWGVYYGTTQAAIQKMPQLVTAMSAGIPSFGGGISPHGLRPASYVGFGDWFFLSMFLTVAFKYDLQPSKTFKMLLGFLIPAMLLVILGVLDSLPAVVPMALAVFVVNGRRLKLSREETFATLYAILMVVGLISIYTFALHHVHGTLSSSHGRKG